MTTPSDRNRLRRVAAEYAEIANSAVMDERRERWRLSNRLLQRTVPFQIEDNGTFLADLTPSTRCEGSLERGCESYLLRAIANHRLIDDDRVFPRFYGVSWAIGRSSICPDLRITRAADATGRELGYETNTPLADLESGLGRLRHTEFSVDRPATYRALEALDAAIGDLVPVRIVGHQAASAGTGLAQTAVHLIGMDDFYMAMLDGPDSVHRFFEFLADDAARYLDWLQAEGLITTNGHEVDCGSGSCVYSDELPRRELELDQPAAPGECWGFIEAQEAVGLSPAMYAEFIHPYQRRIGDRYGLINYGCCEPVHGFWPALKGFANLRKVTVSPWCDVASIAASAGRQVVLSRKPHPMQLCGPRFDPAGFETHIEETLQITQGSFVELIFRDTCPLSGAMHGRVREACAIVNRLVGRG